MVSFYKYVKKYGKQAALVSIAGAGAVIAARPLIGVLNGVWNGVPVMQAVDGALLSSYGISQGRVVNRDNLKWGIVGTGIGIGGIALATWLARK